MNLASSMMFAANLLHRPLSSNLLSQEGEPAPQWVIDPVGSVQFDILASRGNSAAPVLTRMDGISLRIGGGNWQITLLDAIRFRILSSISNSAAPVVSTSDGASISIGA